MAKAKRVSIFCVVCKKYITDTTEKEFRETGHYIDQPEGKHLLRPNLGRSTRKHSRAVKREENNLIRQAALKAEHEARNKGLIEANMAGE